MCDRNKNKNDQRENKILLFFAILSKKIRDYVIRLVVHSYILFCINSALGREKNAVLPHLPLNPLSPFPLPPSLEELRSVVERLLRTTHYKKFPGEQFSISRKKASCPYWITFHVARPTLHVAKPTLQVVRPTIHVAKPTLHVVNPTLHEARPFRKCCFYYLHFTKERLWNVTTEHWLELILW